MAHMAYKYYLSSSVNWDSYCEIKAANSFEDAVDEFLREVLPDYSKKTGGMKFKVSQQFRPFPGATNQRVDITIRTIKNGERMKVALMEDKRRGKESSPAEWAAALEQLTRYMTLVRAEPGQDHRRTLYGAVNIGTHTRFYHLEAYQKQCDDYPGTNGKIYELAADEEEVHRILLDMVARCS